MKKFKSVKEVCKLTGLTRKLLHDYDEQNIVKPTAYQSVGFTDRDGKEYDNKGGLFNRQTCRLYLEPFTLAQTRKYLLVQGMSWSEYDIAECYMIMGGIPYYLSLLENDLSYVQNIDNLFFRKRAELWDEFEHLYRTLFTIVISMFMLWSVFRKKEVVVQETKSQRRNLEFQGCCLKNIYGSQEVMKS